MTGIVFLDFAGLAVSLFDAIVLIWLGLTVVLNAERRPGARRLAGGHWGGWLAGGGLLLGGLFFVSHSAILGHGPDLFTPGMELWWRVGWVPVAVLPYAWYAVMLYYAGFWERSALEAGPDPLQRRHRPGFVLASLALAFVLGWLVLGNALPPIRLLLALDFDGLAQRGGFPVLMTVYPLYIVLCLVLSFDALRRPGPTTRLMGGLARRRARPWLMAASLVLLVVCLGIGALLMRLLWNASQRIVTAETMSLVWWIDLVIATLIGAATVLLGQAVVAYEVFTGKTLPRRGLARYWRNALILAAGASTVLAWSLAVHLRPVNGLILAVLLMTVFYALLSWRSYAERERFIESLRPFVASQQLYDRLLRTGAAVAPATIVPPDVDVAAPFAALCGEVLNTRRAALVALGPLAPLWGAPLIYPHGTSLGPWNLAELLGSPASPQAAALPLDPQACQGMTWAIPLWSERGRIGALLLGEKRDAGLYTQEEIEIARAAGERLIDSQASAEMSRRLMALQRQRLAETQVLDRRTRRALHDDVLPLLHAALLALSPRSVEPEVADALPLLTQAHRQIANLLRELPTATAPEVARLGLVDALRQLVADELPGAFDHLEWQIAPQAEERARALPPLTAEVLFYAAREALRNAARHARPAEGRALSLRVAIGLAGDPAPAGPENLATTGGLLPLEVVIEDDGVGIGRADSTRPAAGSGQGLALHSTLLAVVGGTLSLDSAPGAYTRVTLRVP